MPKVTDIKKYWRDTAAKAGLDEDSIKQVEGLFDKPEALKAFTDGFKPLPDYSHDMENVRNRTQQEKDEEYRTWFNGEKAKYEQNQQVWQRTQDALTRYKQQYGDLTDGDQSFRPNGNDSPNGGKPLTQADIDARMEAKLNEVLARRDAAYLSFRDADFDHMQRFNKPLDRLAFEKQWKEHPEWGGDLFLAYKQFVQPELDKAQTAEWEKKIAQAREEGVRDGYSRRSMPMDNSATTFSPLFDRDEKIGNLSEQEQDRHSRNAFMEGLREKQPTGG